MRKISRILALCLCLIMAMTVAAKADYDAVSDQMGALYYQDFTDDEVRQFEEYLQRIQRNLEEKLKSWAWARPGSGTCSTPPSGAPPR